MGKYLPALGSVSAKRELCVVKRWGRLLTSVAIRPPPVSRRADKSPRFSCRQGDEPRESWDWESLAGKSSPSVRLFSLNSWSRIFGSNLEQKCNREIPSLSQMRLPSVVWVFQGQIGDLALLTRPICRTLTSSELDWTKGKNFTTYRFIDKSSVLEAIIVFIDASKWASVNIDPSDQRTTGSVENNRYKFEFF